MLWDQLPSLPCIVLLAVNQGLCPFSLSAQDLGLKEDDQKNYSKCSSIHIKEW